MKKFFIQRLVIAGTALMLNLFAPAQTSHTTPFVIADAGSHSMLLADLKAKNVKTFNHFTKAWPEAILHSVSDEKDGKYINATINGNILRTRYDNKGRFQSAVLSYPCGDLSEKIANQLEQQYPGYKVFGTVIDVTVRNKTAMLVMIENRNTWRRVRITDDGIDVFEEYAKSK